MSKNTRDQDSKTAKIAAPFRDLLKTLLRHKLKTASDKQELADFLDRSVSFVNQMLYHGEGSLDAWIGALVFAYDLNVSTLTSFLAGEKRAVAKKRPTSQADKIWSDLDGSLTEAEKFYWISLVRTAIDLEQELGIERRRRKKQPTSLQAAESSPYTKKR